MKTINASLLVLCSLISLAGCSADQPEEFPEAAIPEMEEIEYTPFDWNEPAILTEFTWPRYPPSAREQQLEAVVRVRVLVDSSGIVRHASIMDSDAPEVLAPYAIEAAMKYKFKPAKKDGIPVNTMVIMPIGFSPPKGEGG